MEKLHGIGQWALGECGGGDHDGYCWWQDVAQATQLLIFRTEFSPLSDAVGFINDYTDNARGEEWVFEQLLKFAIGFYDLLWTDCYRTVFERFDSLLQGEQSQGRLLPKLTDQEICSGCSLGIDSYGWYSSDAQRSRVLLSK